MILVASLSTKYRSCETKISVPPKSSSASSSTSFESRSRWLVGSSSSSVLAGAQQHARDGQARALAADSTRTGFSMSSPEKRNPPRIVRMCGTIWIGESPASVW
jgi:hypothetical protein